VLQFIVDHTKRLTAKGLEIELPPEMDAALVQAGYKGKLGALAGATVQHRISVLSKAHQLREVKNPCQEAVVRDLLSRSRKAYAKRGVRPNKKAALTKDPLQALLATCDDSLRGVRDRALLLFAWSSGGRRRSEVASAHMQFLKAVGTDAYLYTLVHSKTNQSGTEHPDNLKPLAGVAAEAMKQWLALSQIEDGPIFRRIRKGGHIGEALSAAAVRDIVQQRCELAGLEGNFSAHSLRSGFVTEAGRQKITLPETMAMTGHRSVATVIGYFRAEAPLLSEAARLLD
jgi:integrase